MTLRKLERTEWKGYFDRLYKRRFAAYTAIEFHSRALGAQVQATRALLEGAVYDPRSDILELDFQGLDHLVYRPREVYVDDVVDEPLSFAVRDESGSLQIYLFRPLLRLPPTTGAP